MKIYSMTATFGKLEHRSLSFKKGLNIIEAPNEWGKSTWCAFIVSMLYGIDTGSRSKKDSLADKQRYAPWSGQPMSGKMDICWQGRDITIERSSKGRIPFGNFIAYETHTNLPVMELTAENCGQVLLGVEKEVFVRAGFLRLSDLPVTNDESLRRRLNALVTTGDESGASDDLAQKLKDLKNRCRHNKTGLLPQAEAQRDALKSKLQELSDLHAQSQKIHDRQAYLDTYHKQLDNHLSALQYAANHSYNEKLAAAETSLQTAAERVNALLQTCQQYPPLEQTENALLRLRMLREERENIHTQAQLLPPPPSAPAPIAPLQGLSAEDALKQASSDHALYLKHRSANGRPALFVSLLGALAGIGLILISDPVVRIIGILLILCGGICACVLGVSLRRNTRILQSLLSKYAAFPPEQWVSAATDYAASYAEYTNALQSHQKALNALQEQMASVNEQLQALTQGAPLAQCEQAWQAARNDYNALVNAQKEYERASSLAQALRDNRKDVPPPAFEDTLTFSEAETTHLLADCAYEQRQLQLNLGNCQGRMEALGKKQALEQQLNDICCRIDKLENTYAALTIALETLGKASNELQRRFAPRISQRAQALFSKLTGNRYDRFMLGEDLSVSTAANSEDTIRSALWRSEGTVDQLYLALRLAVAEELTPDAPIILDDALVRFDDDRLRSAIEILKEEAQSRQVIIFTCQSREANI